MSNKIRSLLVKDLPSLGYDGTLVDAKKRYKVLDRTNSYADIIKISVLLKSEGIDLKLSQIRNISKFAFLIRYLDNLIDEEGLNIDSLIDEVEAPEGFFPLMEELRGGDSVNENIFTGAAIKTLREIDHQASTEDYVESRTREGALTAEILFSLIEPSIHNKDKDRILKFLRHIGAAGNLLDTFFDLRDDGRFSIKNLRKTCVGGVKESALIIKHSNNPTKVCLFTAELVSKCLYSVCRRKVLNLLGSSDERFHNGGDEAPPEKTQ